MATEYHMKGKFNLKILKNTYEIFGNAPLTRTVLSPCFKISFISKCKSQTTILDDGICISSGYDDLIISIHFS